jgi:hypothetical protein
MNFSFLRRDKRLAEPNINKEAELGAKAEALLRDETYQNAVRSVREGIHIRWAASPITDVEGQHELRLMLKLLDDIEANIAEVVSTGKLAAVQIEQERAKEKRKKPR